MSNSAWGSDSTKMFHDLTPERVLRAVERLGFKCTGRAFALNSYENRVYEVEVEPLGIAKGMEEGVPEAVTDALDQPHLFPGKKVIKFYRPGRWSKEQILEEHLFIADLDLVEVPVVRPLSVRGETLFQEPESQIYYTVYPKFGGRAPDELSDDQLIQIGRLLGRIHRVGKGRVASQRIQLTPETYGRANLEYLLSKDLIPAEIRSSYINTLNEILLLAEQVFKGIELQRIHGDCHLGNLLWIPDKGAPVEREAGSLAGKPYFLDFDDMINGPVVQDLWLLFPSRLSGDLFGSKREALLTGYEQMNSFSRSELKCVEILRALRFVHFSSWIARRWDDPSFPMAFPQFGTEKYWMGQSLDLREQLGWIRQDLDYPEPAAVIGVHIFNKSDDRHKEVRQAELAKPVNPANPVNNNDEDDDRGNQ